ncbi:TonB-dependent receptor [Elizabethkingia sp. HX WHF]|uniref:TonB-dependent siderophore receptor n=1 Tax=Elizabethkingia TaxID=308865 RepID=UPI0009995BAD|nr:MULTISPECIES: TonB-dependent receptor [Elizabethkingia]ATL45216.1 TonB-dependent receptor [Elizabethkingia miricola]MCL1639909.1 TonB-dependent receptor [Elizabethkingia bruuniana]MDX8566070.1 TonB-dependent receptor [Elizabethkingia sp. HX WHF]OPC21772.1 TonB-dependent receptor [Elizabethkingia bruuniana]
MKKVLLNAVLLSGVLAYAQERDTVNAKKIDEVIINAYIKKDSDYTNKMPLRAIENPQVYSSVDRIALENQMVFTVDDAFRNVTGLQKMWNATGRAGDGGAYVNLRGFISNNSLRNGLVAPVNGTMDAINIEKIEVLKGPSATLYGSNVTSYGGVINRITKKPYETFGGSLLVTGGSYDFYRAQADINTPLTKDKKLLFRVNTAYTTEGNFQNKKVQNTYLAFTPSLTWKINNKLDVNVEFEMYDNRTQAEQNFFFIGSPTQFGYSNMKDLERAGLNYKNPYIGSGLYNTGRTRNLFGQVNYKINEHIKSSTSINSAYSYSNGFNPYFYITTKSYGADPNDKAIGLHRGDQSTRDSNQRYLQVQQNFNFDFHIGNMRNRTVVGADFLRTRNDQFFYSGVIDFVPFTGGMDYSNFNADYVTAYYDANKATLSTWPLKNKSNTYSAYISNVLTLVPGLNVMTSIRYESIDFKGGVRGSNDTPAYTQGAWSPKLGIVYEIIKDKFSVFGNYQNSFTSNGYYVADKASNLKLSDPEKANQWEGGFKANLLNGKINATVNYYNINVRNSLQTIDYTPAPEVRAIEQQMGKRNSKGVELEINAYLVKGFSLIAGVSYNDSKFTETTDASVLGRRPNTASSPWLANFNASYQLSEGSLKGLGFGIGGNYASANRIINTTAGVFELPKYFVMNANVFYDARKFRIGFKADNLTNEHYWIGYTTANPQRLLSVAGSFTYKL